MPDRCRMGMRQLRQHTTKLKIGSIGREIGCWARMAEVGPAPQRGMGLSTESLRRGCVELR